MGESHFGNLEGGNNRRYAQNTLYEFIKFKKVFKNISTLHFICTLHSLLQNTTKTEKTTDRMRRRPGESDFNKAQCAEYKKTSINPNKMPKSKQFRKASRKGCDSFMGCFPSI